MSQELLPQKSDFYKIKKIDHFFRVFIEYLATQTHISSLVCWVYRFLKLLRSQIT